MTDFLMKRKLSDVILVSVVSYWCCYQSILFVN